MMRTILTIAGYIAVFAIVVGGTLALIAYGNGYNYDLKTGHLEHRGLVLVNSIPTGATIMLGNKKLTQKTPYRSNFVAGEYGFTLALDGYRTWTKRIPVVPSQVSFVQYVVLLPYHIPVSEVGNYPAITQVVASRDHQKVAFVVPSGPGSGVWSLDTASGNQTRIYTSASATDAAPAETVQVTGWSDDDSRLLIKNQIGDASSTLVIGSSPTNQPVNLTTAFQVNGGDVRFNRANSGELYWLSPDGLRRIDLSNKTVSAILAEHVAAYTFAADRMLYVSTPPTGKPALFSLDRSGHAQQLIGNLPVSSSYSLDFATYIGTPEVVVVAADSHVATLYSNIYDHPSTKTLNAPATSFSFNGDGRFVVLTDQQHVATYDLERNTTYTMGPINSTVTNLSWFDNYHLIFTRGGQIVMSEFDGNYAVAITRAGELPPFNTADGKKALVVSPTSTGSALIKSVKIRQ